MGRNAGRRDFQDELQYHRRLPTVSVNTSYFEAFEVLSITPEPQLMSAAGDSTGFEFGASATPVRVIFRVEARELGRARANWHIGNAGPLTTRQFVYP